MIPPQTYILIAIIVILIALVILIVVLIKKRHKLAVQLTQDDGTKEISYKSGGGFGTFLIKLLLIAGIVLFGLVNYRRLSFSKGWSQTEINDNMSMTEAVLTLTGISKVEYYDKAPFPFTSENYVVYIETSQKNYISSATQDDIDALNALGIFSKSMRPQKITPIPFYVEVILGIIILAIPFGGRKKRQE